MLEHIGDLRGEASLIHQLGFHQIPETLLQRGFVQWRDRLEYLVGKRPPNDGAELGYSFDRAVTVQVVQVMRRRAGLLRPQSDKGEVRVQGAPCMQPDRPRPYTHRHGDVAA